MKNILARLHKAVLSYVLWGWPIVLLNVALDRWAGESPASWRSFLCDAAFAWFLCAPVAPITLLLDRFRRERAMARLCGAREGDERERAVTGEAARSSLLLALSLQTVLLAMSMTTVRLFWNPLAKKAGEHGLITVGFSFDPARHLDPFGAAPASDQKIAAFGAALAPKPNDIEFGGFLLSPSSFSVLALLILIELAAFKTFSQRRYEGMDA
jgi:hypothetical protein